jgi:flagellar basal-body rod protein FlgB
MINPVFRNDNYQLAQRLLDVAALRQETIAANIANVDTPGYRRLEVSPDFASLLKSQLASGSPLSSSSLKPKVVEDTRATTTRPDGNTVEIEHELVAMNRNAVEYEFLTEIVSRNIKQLRTAITGRTV